MLTSGTYVLEGPIEITGKADIRISARVRGGAVLQQTDLDADCFHVQDSQEIAIDGLRFIGPGKLPKQGSEGSAVHLHGSTGCMVTRSEASGFSVAGVRMDGSTNCQVTDSVFRDITTYGVLCIASDRNRIDRNTIHGIGVQQDQIAYCVALTGSSSGQFANDFSDLNRVSGNVCFDSFWEGLDAHNGTGNTFVDNQVLGDNKMRRGIVAVSHLNWPTLAPSRLIIANNFVELCTDGGIVFDGDAANTGNGVWARSILVNGNRVGGCNYGIRFHDSIRVNVVGNIVSGNFNVGILCGFDNKHIAISNNSISNNGSPGKESTGIVIGNISGVSAGPNDNVSVTGNQIFFDGGSGTQVVGINFKTAYSNVLLAGNLFDGHTGASHVLGLSCGRSDVTCEANQGL